MSLLKVTAFLAIFQFHCFCFGAAAENRLVKTFFYDSATGKCKNANGDEGYNQFDKDDHGFFGAPTLKDNLIIYERRNAECLDLSNINFDDYLRTKEMGFNSIELLEWDFRGAKFSNTKIKFYSGTVNFHGVDMNGIEAVSATFFVLKDKFTKTAPWCKSFENG